MYGNRKFKIILGLLLIAILVSTIDVSAQCPMCRMSAETNLQNGGTQGKGLNAGILYMLSLPYLLVASLGFVWWRNRRLLASDILEDNFSNN